MVETLPLIDSAGTFVPIFLAIAPIFFIIKRKDIYIIIIVIQLIFAYLSYINKSMEIYNIDLYNSLVGLMMSFITYEVVIRTRTNDFKSKYKLRDITTKDTFTGLLNKNAFLNAANKYLDENDNDLYSALIIIDLDNFKQINDKKGHEIGDIVIKYFATILKDTVRASDLVGRFGGDEFIILLKDLNDISITKTKCELIQKNTSSITDECPSIDQLTCSMGVIMFAKNKISLSDAFKEADRLLYVSKNNGCNQFNINQII